MNRLGIFYRHKGKRPIDSAPDRDIPALKRRAWSMRARRGWINPRVINLDFSVAQTNLEIIQTADLVEFSEATNPSTDKITIRFHDKSGDPVTFRPGKTWDGGQFNRLYLSWAAVPGATGQLTLVQQSAQSDLTVT